MALQMDSRPLMRGCDGCCSPGMASLLLPYLESRLGYGSICHAWPLQQRLPTVGSAELCAAPKWRCCQLV